MHIRACLKQLGGAPQRRSQPPLPLGRAALLKRQATKLHAHGPMDRQNLAPSLATRCSILTCPPSGE